jgi:hypothetical protein
MKGLLIAGAIALLVYLTSYIARLPESNCTTSPASEIWSPDRAYKATLLVKDCNLSETIFYSIRVDAYSPPLSTGFFTHEVIEDDERPSEPPTVRWDTPRKLAVEMKTRTLHGTVQRHSGDDLTIVRTYIARQPDAFPNY